MRRRRLVLVACLMAAVSAVGLLLLALNRFGRQLKVAGFAQVQTGMTLTAVESLLGGPPGNYGRNTGITGSSLEYMAPPSSTTRVWCDDDNCFEIYFDANDQVAGKHRRAFWHQQPNSESMWQWLRRKLGF